MFEDRVMCWNCRGAGNRDFLCEMREMMKEFRPSIVALLEPQISGSTVDEVCAKLGRKSWIRSEATGFSGGVWVLWDDKAISLSLKEANRFFLHFDMKSAGRK